MIEEISPAAAAADRATLEAAFGLVGDWRCAIDGGANRGVWTLAMAARFATVHAFEPAPDSFAALQAAIAGRPNVVAHRAALWHRADRMAVQETAKRAGRSRSRYVQPGGTVPGRPIDSLDLGHCGLIKLDLEGAEAHALLGALATLCRCRPVVILECDRHAKRFGMGAETAAALLEALGAGERFRNHPDRVFAWP